MSSSEDSQEDSRPISVAELLARNGTIGAPPVGGRRRRRKRRDPNALTVAELTSEIPVVKPDEADSDTGAAPGGPEEPAAEPVSAGEAAREPEDAVEVHEADDGVEAAEMSQGAEDADEVVAEAAGEVADEVADDVAAEVADEVLVPHEDAATTGHGVP